MRETENSAYEGLEDEQSDDCKICIVLESESKPDWKPQVLFTVRFHHSQK